MMKKNEMCMKIGEVDIWAFHLLWGRGFEVGWDGLYTAKGQVKKRYKDGDKVKLCISVVMKGVKYCAVKVFERVKGTDELRMDNDMIAFHPFNYYAEGWESRWNDDGRFLDDMGEVVLRDEDAILIYIGTDWRNIKKQIYNTSDYIEHYERGEEWEKFERDSEFDRLEQEIRRNLYFGVVEEEVCA